MIILCSFFGCEKETFATADPDQAVVEGYLFPGRIAEIKINQQFIYELNDTSFSKPITGLEVLLSNITTGNSEILKYNDDEKYISENKIEHSGTYRIEFIYAGKTVWAETTVPNPISNFKGDADELIHTERFSDDTLRYVNYVWDNPDSEYYMVFMYNFETWNLPVYNTSPSKLIRSNPVQDTIKTVNSKGFDYYGRYNIVLFKLNQEYINLYYASDANSQYMGNPPTNINNGFGIFTAMSSDTLVLRIR